VTSLVSMYKLQCSYNVATVHTLVQGSNSNPFSIIKLSPNATCKGSLSFCKQVLPYKFIFMETMSRENFGELLGFFPKGLMPLKIQTKFKSCMFPEFVIQNPFGI
jgi:hypothetical protein